MDGHFWPRPTLPHDRPRLRSRLPRDTQNVSCSPLVEILLRRWHFSVVIKSGYHRANSDPSSDIGLGPWRYLHLLQLLDLPIHAILIGDRVHRLKLHRGLLLLGFD